MTVPSVLHTTAVEGIGHIATYYDLAIVSTGAQEPMFTDKNTYPTLVRVADSYKDIGLAALEVVIRSLHTLVVKY